MFLKTSIYAIFLVLACNTLTVDAVKCWECFDDGKDPSCRDVFVRSESDKTNSSMYKECPHGCHKGTEGSLSAPFWAGLDWNAMRGCYDPTTDPNAVANRGKTFCYGPYNVNYIDPSTGVTVNSKGDKFCLCQTDFCNSAQRPTGVATAFLAAILVALVRVL